MDVRTPWIKLNLCPIIMAIAFFCEMFKPSRGGSPSRTMGLGCEYRRAQLIIRWSSLNAPSKANLESTGTAPTPSLTSFSKFAPGMNDRKITSRSSVPSRIICDAPLGTIFNRFYRVRLELRDRHAHAVVDEIRPAQVKAPCALVELEVVREADAQLRGRAREHRAGVYRLC